MNSTENLVEVTKVYAMIAEILEVEVEEVENCEDIVEDLDADSMSILELLVEIEKAYNIKIPSEKSVKFNDKHFIIKTIEEELLKNGKPD